jgi:hypothetical protein
MFEKMNAQEPEDEENTILPPCISIPMVPPLTIPSKQVPQVYELEKQRYKKNRQLQPQSSV